MTTRRFSWMAVLVMAVVVLGSGQSLAGTAWTGAANSNWSDSGNWDAGGPYSQDAAIGGGSNQPVILDADDYVTGLTVGTINGAGTLNIAGNHLTVSGTMNLGVANNGTVNLSGGSLTVNSIKPGSGGATFNFTGGTLTANSIGMSLTNAGGILRPGGETTIGSTVISGGIDSTTNVALGKPASQSSDPGYGGVPSRAVDGNTSGNWGEGSVTHTGNAPQEWWKVDLGAMTTIGNIKIWNRTDCCGDRLSNFHVSVFDASGTTEVWRRDFFTTGGYPNPLLEISGIGATGRYIQVQQNGANFLSLAEVQVYSIFPANYTQYSAGTLAMKISGSTADQLAVGGIMNLAGTLDVTSMGMVLPGTFNLLNAVSFNGSFDTVHLPTGHGLVWDTSALYTTGSITALANQWSETGGGTWNDTAHWSSGYVPGVADDVASLLGGIADPSQVTVDSPVTVGAIQFDNVNAYTVAGPKPITMEVSSGNAGISVANGSHEISAPLTLKSSLQTMVNNTGNNLTLSGLISDDAISQGITKLGPGTLTLSGAEANTYTGDTTLNAGKLVLAKTAGTPAVSGNLVINPSSGWAGGANGVELGASEQLGPGTVIRFTGSDWSGFRPLGFTQTVAGIDCVNGKGVIENAREGQTLAANGTLIVNNDVDYAYNGYIRNGGNNLGTLSLVKDGPGTLTLSGTNITYTGTTTINAGTLMLTGNHNVIQSSTSVTINEGATLATNTAQTINGSVTLNGGDVVGSPDPLWGSYLFNRQVRVTADSTISAINVLPNNAGYGGFVVDAGVTLNVPGVLSNVNNNGSVGALLKAGPGTMVLTNANTYTGGTTVNAGTLQLGDGVFYNGSVAGNIVNNASLVFANPSEQSYGGAISGKGGLTKTAAGTLVLSAPSSYQGPTVIREGTVKLQWSREALPGAQYWLDASDPASVDPSFATVETWNDLSGNNRNFATNGAVAPEFVSAGLNGLPVVRFNGVNTRLNYNGDSPNAQTVFIVNKPQANTSGADGIWGWLGVAGQADQGIRLGGTAGYWLGKPDGGGNTGDYSFGGISGGTYITTAAKFDANTCGFDGFGTPHILAAYGNSSWPDTAIGEYLTSHGRWYQGDIGEILVYNYALSAAERQSVEQYLATKWLGYSSLGILPAGSALSVAQGAVLDLNGVNQTVGGLANDGAVGGTIVNDGGFDAQLAVIQNGDTSFSGLLTDGVTNRLALRKDGTGTLTLVSSHNYTGGTTVNGGQLKLDFSAAGAPASNLLMAAGTLTLGGGTLNLVGANGAANSQAFSGLTVNAGASAIVPTQNGAAGIVVSLGAIARTGGTVDFTLPTAGQIAASSGAANQILLDGGVAYATVGGNDWAAKDASNAKIVGLSTVGGYTPSTAGSLSGNADVAAGVDTTLGGGTTITSLRFNQNESRTIDIGGSSLTTGGILVTGNVQTAGSIIANGTLMGPLDRDLVIIQNSTEPFTIEASIQDNADFGGTPTDLTKSGGGVLVLSGANTYGGVTRINAGTLSVGGTAALNGALMPIVLGSGTTSGTLEYTGAGFGESLSGGVTVNAAGGGITSTSGTLIVSTAAVTLNGPLTVAGDGNTTISSAIRGSATLVKSGAGTLEITSQNNYAFTGDLTVREGTLLLNTPRNTHPVGNNVNRTITVEAGATLTAPPECHNPFGTVSEPPRVVVNGTFNPADYVHMQNLEMTGGLIAANWSAVDGLDMRNSPTVAIHAAPAASTIASKMTIYGGTVTFAVERGAAEDDLLVSGAIVGGGSVVKSGPGRMVMAGDSTYSGGTTVNAGTLQFGDGVASNGSARGAIVNNATVIFANPVDQTLENAISGTGGLTKTAAGTLTVASPQTYQGPTAVREGTLKLQWNREALPGAQYWLDASNPASVDPNFATVDAWNDLSGNNRNFATNGAAAPAFVADGLNGLPVVRFNGVDNRLNYAGDSPTAQTVFIVNKPQANNSGLDGIWGWLGVAGQQDHGIRLTGNAGYWQGLPDGGGNANDYTVGGNGSTYITTAAKFDANTCNFDGFGTPHILTAYGNSAWDNTAIGEYLTSHGRWYQGDIAEILVYGTTLTAGERQAVEQYLASKWLGYTTPALLPATTALSVAQDAVLDLNGVSAAVGSLADDGPRGGTISNGGEFDAQLAVVQGVDTSFSGSLTDGLTNKLSLLKDGDGTLTLAGPNTYSGGTTVNGGTLEIASPDALPAGRGLSIGAGGTVVLGEGLSTTAGTANSAHAPAAVPEPGSLALLGSGIMLGLAAWLRRRARRG